MTKIKLFVLSITSLLLITATSCDHGYKAKIVKLLDEEEYAGLMKLTLDEFDQSSEGFRRYYSNYELIRLLIPEYIVVNNLSASESRNLHWHLGQIQAFNSNYDEAIGEMKQSYEGGSITWGCYVSGSIAYLEKDKSALEEALATLNEQENQMNIQFLEKFVKYFDKSYSEAYNAPY